VTPGDFDGDGRLDLLAGNWGENSFYELYRGSASLGAKAVPLQVFHGELHEPGNHVIIEAYGTPDLAQPIRSLARIGPAIPWVVASHPSYRAFAEARLPDMLAERAVEAQRAEARWLATTLFMNRGDQFEARRLPAEAQFSPAFGVAVADFNGDGRQDAFLAQNNFGYNFGMTRDDAGRGLVLLGDGMGGFQPLSTVESGIEMLGEGRDATVADFDADGRPDLVVAQQGGATRVFRNRGASQTP
jgi:hypothetical protein